jgi:hypothetical protein
MPTSKSLRQPAKRQGSATSVSRRKTCRFCNNLDPRGHPNTIYQSEGSKDATASLTLVLDAFELSRTKAPIDKGCRFCDVVVQALDTFCGDWRGARRRIVVDIKEKGVIRVNVDGEKWKGEAVEIYAASGRESSFFSSRLLFYVPCSLVVQFVRSRIVDHEDLMSSPQLSHHRIESEHGKSPLTTFRSISRTLANPWDRTPYTHQCRFRRHVQLRATMHPRLSHKLKACALPSTPKTFNHNHTQASPRCRARHSTNPVNRHLREEP